MPDSVIQPDQLVIQLDKTGRALEQLAFSEDYIMAPKTVRWNIVNAGKLQRNLDGRLAAALSASNQPIVRELGSIV